MGSVFYLHFAVSRGRRAQKVYQLEKFYWFHILSYIDLSLYMYLCPGHRSERQKWYSTQALTHDGSGMDVGTLVLGDSAGTQIDISWHFNVTCSHVHPHWTDLGRYWCGNDNQWWDRVGNYATFLFLQTLQKCQNTTWGWGVNESLACIFSQAEGTTITTSISSTSISSTTTTSRVLFFSAGAQ